MATGIITPPPIPWSMRAAMRKPSDGAAAHSADDTVNRPSDSTNIVLRPKRSADHPLTIWATPTAAR